MRIPLALLGLLAGCTTSSEESAALDTETREAVVASFAAAQPEERLALVFDLDLFLPDDGPCPMHELVDDGHDRWTGGCLRDDGIRADGVLERFENDEIAWVAGDHFQIADEDDVLLYLDGAVEVTTLGELLLVEAALSTCGGPSDACPRTDFETGLTTVDLAYTLYPASGFPDHYQVTISGLVAAPDQGPATIHGAWTLDTVACSLEPTSGSAVVSIDDLYFLEFDGLGACDTCAYQTVDGLLVDPTCARWLP